MIHPCIVLTCSLQIIEVYGPALWYSDAEAVNLLPATAVRAYVHSYRAWIIKSVNFIDMNVDACELPCFDAALRDAYKLTPFVI